MPANDTLRIQSSRSSKILPSADRGLESERHYGEQQPAGRRGEVPARPEPVPPAPESRRERHVEKIDLRSLGFIGNHWSHP